MPVASIYALMLLSLLIVLQIVGGTFYGFITMLIHIWVLLVALDRTQPGKLANEFLSRWRRGDLQGTLFLQEQGLFAKERASLSGEIYASLRSS